MPKICKWDYRLLADSHVEQRLNPREDNVHSLYKPLGLIPMFVMLDLNVSLNIILYLLIWFILNKATDTLEHLILTQS